MPNSFAKAGTSCSSPGPPTFSPTTCNPWSSNFFCKSDQMRNTIATGSAPRGVEIQDQHLAFVLGKNGPLSVGSSQPMLARDAVRRRHGISGPSWWTGYHRRGSSLLSRYYCKPRKQQQEASDPLMKSLNVKNACALPGRFRFIVRISCNHSRSPLSGFHSVPGAPVHRAHDTHPRPTGRDQQADSVQNRRDGKDCLSTRLAYRRLDTS